MPRLVLWRRVPAPTGGGERIAFHRDPTHATVNVALNSDAQFEGGRLMYVADGRVVCPARAAGSAIVHDSTLVHAVSTLRGGARYSLFALRESGQRGAPGASTGGACGFPCLAA